MMMKYLCNRPRYVTTALCFATAASSVVLFTAPAAAVDGEVLITQAKALAGGVTVGDAPGFPVSISASGSYRLASRLQVPANKDGIDVNAVEVTIDLNGFRIDGGKVAGKGIVGRQRSLTVRNGSIRAFTVDGIHTLGALMIVQDMRIFENGRHGVNDNGTGYGRIISSTIFGNGSLGIECWVSCHVEGNMISGNAEGGVNMNVKAGSNGSGTVLGNTIVLNGGRGIWAFGGRPVGVGNNTVVGNTDGQIQGATLKLFPNACSPQACP